MKTFNTYIIQKLKISLDSIEEFDERDNILFDNFFSDVDFKRYLRDRSKAQENVDLSEDTNIRGYKISDWQSGEVIIEIDEPISFGTIYNVILKYYKQ